MSLVSPVTVLFLALLAPHVSPPLSRDAPAPAPQTSKLAELFPLPHEGLTIVGGEASEDARKRGDAAPDGKREPMKLADLLDEFSRVTGVALQISRDTKNALRNVPTGLNRTIVVPASEVYRVVEALLVANDFVFIRLSDAEPRVWTVQSLVGQGGRGAQLRNDAYMVAESELAAWSAHPAMLVTTTLQLPNTDVRTLSNSMRTLFTDANTQQIIPLGSNGLLITGFAPNVASLVRMLHAIDDSERAAAQARPAAPAPAAQ